MERKPGVRSRDYLNCRGECERWDCRSVFPSSCFRHEPDGRASWRWCASTPPTTTDSGSSAYVAPGRSAATCTSGGRRTSRRARRSIYKQPAGGPLTRRRRLTRRIIVDGIAARVRVTDRRRRVMMRDPGGDAIDAVLAALGAAQAFATVDHSAIARHRRYSREGHPYF
jgi:hypothetical protein